MPRLKSVLAASLAAIAILSACKKSSNKNDSDNNDPSARTVANFSGTYILSALTASALGQTANLYDSLEACAKDDQVILKSDMTVTYSDGTVKCDPPTDSTGTWSLSANKDSIYLGTEGEAISSWDGTTLVLTGSQTFNSIPATTTATFKKQP